jgi:transposase
VKSEGQQAGLTGHGARERLGTERPALAHQSRGLLLEYGIISAQGIQRLRRALPELLTAETLPELVREVVGELRERLLEWDRRITDYDHRLNPVAKQHEATRRVMQVEGAGPITATVRVATLGTGAACQHGRQFAACALIPIYSIPVGCVCRHSS